MYNSVRLITVICIFGIQKSSCSCPVVTQVTEPVDHSECPTWDTKTNLLFFVDIHSGRIFSLDVTTKRTNVIKLDGDVAPIIPDKEQHTFVVGLNKSIVKIKWDGIGLLKNQKVLTTVQSDDIGSRFNDGKADSKGRIWIGTMGYEVGGVLKTFNAGKLFKISKKTLSDPTPVLTVNISNGCAWNKDNTKFFYIDTPTLQVVQFDFDNEQGHIFNKKVIFDFKKRGIKGVPDGMTIDKDDNLWIAANGGWNVIKVNPYSGELLENVSIPAAQVTSVAWGDKHLDTLFVTTSRFTLTEQQKEEQPLAGSVFAVKNLNTHGGPIFYADLF